MGIRTVFAAVFLALPLAVMAQDSAPAATSSVRTTTGDIELGDLIERFAKRTGKQFIIDPRVRAQVNLAGMDPDRISYDKLLAILTVNYFVAFEQGDWITVVPDANARQLPTPVYADKNFKAGPDELVTLIVPVKRLCSAQLVPVLRPLMPQSAHMAAYPDSNTLILTDHAGNIRRIVSVLEAMERNAPDGDGCKKWEAATK